MQGAVRFNFRALQGLTSMALAYIQQIQHTAHVQLGYSGNVMAKLFMPLLKRSICVCRNAAQTKSLSLYCQETVLYNTLLFVLLVRRYGEAKGEEAIKYNWGFLHECRLLKYS